MRTPPPGRAFLRCELLEPREMPATLVQVSESFDTGRGPYLPAGWTYGATNDEQYYATTSAAAMTGPTALAVYGTRGVDSFAWKPVAAGTDATVSAAIRSDTPAPILVFARGSGLNSKQPSYIGASLTTGGTVELREVQNGVVRVIQTVTPTEPAAGKGWLRLVVSVSGGTANVVVTRPSDGRYLAPNGQWTTTATVTATGTATTGTGVVGIGRLGGPSGTAYVDDVTASAATPGSPSVVPPTIPPTVPPVVPPTIPPVVPPVVPPTIPPTVPPTVPPTSDLPHHYSHIRIASLAYSATPVGDFEKNLLRDSVDLVVSNPKFLDTFAAAGPETPQLVYSNVSNLYGDLLTDWLSYADRTGADREAGFYHVSEPTAWQGDSPSSQPVTWFWKVTRQTGSTTTDATSASRGKGTATVAFGGTGDAVTVGFPDRFRQVNVALTTAAKGNWAAGWEYVSATDAAGNPTAWKPLTLLADGTGGLRSDGAMTFDPPADWVPAKVNGGAALFTIRVRTAAGTAADAPVAKSILGRDYVAANGGVKGTIPAFDTVADTNGDGYLTDAEFASHRAGFDARFESESRLFYPYYGQMRFVTNPTSISVQQWAADYHVRQLALTPVAGGLFLDNSNGKPPLNGAKTVESSKDHPANSAKLVAAVTAAVAPRITLANTAGARAEADPVGAAATGAFEEFLIRPTEASWSQLLDAKDIVDRRLKAGADFIVIDSHPGSTATTDDRTEIGTLAYYYLVADPEKTFLMFFGGYSPSAAWDKRWTPAATVNVGRPTGTMTTFATGTDPENSALKYNVYAREYENGLTLFKPRSYLLGKGTGTTADATATTHTLGGNYRSVQADGSLGPVITSITLRNGEGAVLLKA